MGFVPMQHGEFLFRQPSKLPEVLRFFRDRMALTFAFVTDSCWFEYIDPASTLSQGNQ